MTAQYSTDKFEPAPQPRYRTTPDIRARVARALARFPQGGTICAVANAAAVTIGKTVDALHDLRDAGFAEQSQQDVVPELWRAVRRGE